MLTICGCGGKKSAQKLTVYNWGQYMDPKVIDMFEKETGIEVTYTEFDTNETMYPVVANGQGQYDVVCPSDYMIQKMIGQNMLAKLNTSNIPNLKYIDKEYMQKSETFDQGNQYSVPYFWGTVGILYNKKMVKGPIDSWSVLWDKQYQDNILMQKSVRDAFGIVLKYLGYSANTTNEAEIEKAKQKLMEQKNSGVVQAYVIDEVRDKMIAGEAAIGVIYSGEALVCMEENKDLDYVIPKEGSNVWIDSWVIPKDSKHKENAEKFINFLCRPDVAAKNFEFVTYSIPSEEGRKLISNEKYRNSAIVFPDKAVLNRCEAFTYLGEKVDKIYNDKWKELMGK